MKNTFSLLTRNEKRRIIPLTLGTVFMSILEVVGIGSIGPFMAVVADPTVIYRHSALQRLYEIGKFESESVFLIAMGILTFFMVCFSTASKMFVQYAIYKYTGNRRYSMGLRLFNRYLYQPYGYFLTENTSELSKNLLGEVDFVVDGVLWPCLDVFAKGTIAVAILVFLIALNPWTTLCVFGLLGAIIAAIYAIVRLRLATYGGILREANRARYKLTTDAFRAIKEVKILGKERFFIGGFRTVAREFSTAQATFQILSTVPVYAIQALAVGFAIVLTITVLVVHGTLVSALPLMTIYAFAVQRLLPNLYGIFSGVSSIRYYGSTVQALENDMSTLSDISSQFSTGIHSHKSAVEPFLESIELQAVSYSYPSSGTKTLHGVNLTVVKNTTVGFVGPTGCGKTTLADVIMGLLAPTEGRILADGKIILPTKSAPLLGAWQSRFGYVPQDIYLTDDTIAANIAFGVPEASRDMDAVIRAASIANIDAFIGSELPAGYETTVGEDGLRLSGGQRQRIGIARALYHDPELLVLDEATNALDSVTEDGVMDAIHNLTHSKTMLIIAHRITTLKECDQIFVLDAGRLVDNGNFAQLTKRNKNFQALARVQR